MVHPIEGGSPMRHRIKFAATGVAALCLVAACGHSGSSATVSNSPASSSTPSSSSSPAPNAAGSFGTLSDVCGPGNATGATSIGVTDTTIRAGTIADVGWSEAPGLLQPIFDAAHAFVGWCNAAGGINGRKIVLDARDSAYSNYLPQVKASCPTDLALVGSMGILDNTGVSAWEACGLPNLTAATVSEQAANAKLMIPLTPIPADQETIGGFHYFFSTHPSWKEHVGSLYANGTAGDREQHTYNEAIEADGGKIVYTAEYTETTVNWTPYVEAMKSAGVQFLFLNDTVEQTAGIESAMATLGWYPDIQISPSQLYESSTLSLAGKDAKNYYVYIPTTPFEAASISPAIKEYLTLLKKYAPKAQLTFFGETAFSAWLLFAEGVKSCGNDVTRSCILKDIDTQTAWTGGGMQGAIDPAANKATDCFIVMKVDGTKFVQAYPSKLGTYDCNPANAPVVKP
jgi:ABC-type branched-subunit amino acid transport system substrate-binding protein